MDTEEITGRYRFPNGYGASVIANGYGSGAGRYELAVLDSRGRIVYDTPITDNVIGWLSAAGVADTLAAIAALPERI